MGGDELEGGHYAPEGIFFKKTIPEKLIVTFTLLSSLFLAGISLSLFGVEEKYWPSFLVECST